mgnify:CR=1 FL=1
MTRRELGHIAFFGLLALAVYAICEGIYELGVFVGSLR